MLIKWLLFAGLVIFIIHQVLIPAIVNKPLLSVLRRNRARNPIPPNPTPQEIIDRAKRELAHYQRNQAEGLKVSKSTMKRLEKEIEQGEKLLEEAKENAEKL